MSVSSYNSHNKKLLVVFILCFNILSIHVFAQQKNYTASNAHAHNDYMHTVPFHTAFDAGFGSIEADVYPVNGVLYVAHNKKDIQPGHTLKSLYIDPLLHELAKDSLRQLKLLIDVKENYKESLRILLEEIEPLQKYLVAKEKINKPVIILISGERPPPAEYKNYPGYIYFDDDLRLKHTPEEWERVGQVSLSFRRYSNWNGKDEISNHDKNLLQNVIDSVHHSGKTIRFWEAPDNEKSWKLQMELGADLIGTDEIDELAAFLNDRQKRK
ncbi:MAG: alkaline phosphatase [Ginsengibacter sp.]